MLSVPLITQDTDYECGSTCLAAVLQYHGKHCSPAQLSELARTTTDGTDHGGLVDAAIATGASVIVRDHGSLGELEELIRRGLPVIVGWWSMAAGDSHYDSTWSRAERRARDRGHYSVVCAVTATSVVLMDPEEGMREMSRAELETVWYDTDGDAYERVDRWYLVPHYANAS